MLQKGRGVAQDLREEIDWLPKAADRGSVPRKTSSESPWPFAVALHRSTRKRGRGTPRPQRRITPTRKQTLGAMLYQARGTAQNDREAVEWFRKGATQGSAAAHNSLGAAYKSGKGLLQDYDRCSKCYELAARQRDGRAVGRDLVHAHACSNLPSAMNDPYPDDAAERDLANRLNSAQPAEAQRLAREWSVGKPLRSPRSKAVASSPPI